MVYLAHRSLLLRGAGHQTGWSRRVGRHSGRCGFRGQSFLVLICTLIVWLLAATSTLVARPADQQGRGLSEPFPGYQAVCGMPILYLPTPNVSLAMRDTQNQPLVILDPRLSLAEDRARRAFLAAHECAHHKLNHTSLAGLLSRRGSASVVLDQELSADCWAAELLSKLGHDEIVTILAEHFYRRGLYSPGAGYPSGLNRSNIIRICGEQGRRHRQARAAP